MSQETESSLEALAQKEYPGRFIIVGQSPERQNVVVYGITGRSAGSQARKLVPYPEDGVVRVEPANGSAAPSTLLFYPTIAAVEGHVVVSNGLQTELIVTGLKNAGDQNKYSTKLTLQTALGKPSYRYDPQYGWVDITSFEPDEPNYTPRISGLVGRDGHFALDVVFRMNGEQTGGDLKEFELKAGRGKLLPTYAGANQDPLPAFKGAPLDVRLAWTTARETAEAVYTALKPEFAVAVAVLQYPHDKPPALDEDTLSIINQNERPNGGNSGSQGQLL